MPPIVCAEDWFDSAEDEQALHQTQYYRETVVPDEERMFRRDNAWVSAVLDVEVIRDGPLQPFRVLSFGGAHPTTSNLQTNERVECLRLRRLPPLSNSPVIVSAWASTIEVAQTLAATLGGFSFVAAPVALLAPPVSPWTQTAQRNLG